MKNLPLVILAISALIFGSCSSPQGDPLDALYYNSFENHTDLDGFEGYAAQVSDDAPAGGADQSLLVSGGCIAPHFYGEIGPFDRDHTINLAFYGKSLDGFGGSLTLHVLSNPQERIDVLVEEKTWQLYERGSIVLPAGEILMMNFMSGGIAAATTLFDEIALYSDTE